MGNNSHKSAMDSLLLYYFPEGLVADFIWLHARQPFLLFIYFIFHLIVIACKRWTFTSGASTPHHKDVWMSKLWWLSDPSQESKILILHACVLTIRKASFDCYRVYCTMWIIHWLVFFLNDIKGWISISMVPKIWPFSRPRGVNRMMCPSS